MQHPNTYAHPEDTSLEVPALGLKKGVKPALDLTVPVLLQAGHQPRGCSYSFPTEKLKTSDPMTGVDGPEARSREPKKGAAWVQGPFRTTGGTTVSVAR